MALAETPTNPPIETWITQLSSDQWKVRQQATERFREAQQLARNAAEEKFFARRAAALPGD